MPKYFELQAGPTALKHLRTRGLDPDDISVIPAAAGGPKWLTLHAIDKYLLKSWFADRKKPLHLVGASAGAWRMLCYALPDPIAALDRYRQYYIEQHYKTYPPPSVVSANMVELLNHTLGGHTAKELNQNATMKLNVISTLASFGVKSDRAYKVEFAKLAAKNLVSRKWLNKRLKRIVFTNTSEKIIKEDHFVTRYLKFTDENLNPGLRSTGSIPLVMEPVTGLPEVEGTLWDGALIDYHMGCDYKTEGLIFYPHFANSITEGWLDKYLPWRKFKGDVLDRMILLCPSQEFIDSLPDSKIPDRKDFETYFDNNDHRVKNWYEVTKRGQDMVEEFHDYWKRGKLGAIATSF